MKSELQANYVAEMVRIAMIEKYGRNATRDGYKVTTTIDSSIQNAATYSLRRGLLEYTQRQGYRGPIQKIDLSTQNVSLPLERWSDEIRLSIEDLNIKLFIFIYHVIAEKKFDHNLFIPTRVRNLSS